ncbi:MAG TPA: CRISPR-associated endonuclease Cas2 [Anaerolineae bacterium]|nr:CRISPR-associated endonuclease Cas2 [Anaerolineae bacterium]
MVAGQFVVVAYDVPDDRRRERLHKALLNYGTPVQYSLFECLADEEELKRMKKQVQRIIKPRLDHVRYYYLCKACVKRIESTLGPEVAHEVEVLVV